MIEQRSVEWYLVKQGKVSASDCHKLMKGDGTRRLYMCDKAAERMSHRLTDNFPNKHIERGIVQEPEAIREYERRTGSFTIDGYWVEKQTWGCTPDAFVGDDGLLSIKCPLAKNVVRIMLSESYKNDANFTEYYWQLQCEMAATGRSWGDLALYCKEMIEPEHQMYIRRIERNEEDIASLLQAIDEFNAELDDVLVCIGVKWRFNTEDNIRNAEPPQLLDLERYMRG